ncbi:PucR family transcriptional regulator [Actinokineospora iranica]|uniref:PucR C-terminal helix-turn-helix domain-containing protein n=1 Tax=Actinokineospora iranica TaxID=1271860 RepID=A0A1G6LDX5_9PSEU|nr:PucR family transcriptional regulator [Actinokineospora iranica]SDC41458.1 PucR C-terminal helix-turn-helix domain-containing protein [Actinokineospora iranica]
MTAMRVVEQDASRQGTVEDAIRREVLAEVRSALRAEAAEIVDTAIEPLVATVMATVQCCLDTLFHPERERTPAFRLQDGMFADSPYREPLLRAYRIGGQVAWRHVSRYARQHGLPAGAVARSAEVIFAYLDQLSTVAGTPRSAFSRTSARKRLVRLLLAEAPAPRGELAEVSRTAEWEPPTTVRVIALRRQDSAAAFRPHLADKFLVDLEGAEPCLVLRGTEATPDADALRAMLPGWIASIGPVTPLAQARASLRVAIRALTLAERGLIPASPVLDWADHPLTLSLFTDELLVDQLVEQRLAPLADLTPRQRDRMIVTLHEWLASQCRVSDTAVRLGVHQQTVRYRIQRIEELFGDQLADPRGRFELELAVRATVLRGDLAQLAS